MKSVRLHVRFGLLGGSLVQLSTHLWDVGVHNCEVDLRCENHAFLALLQPLQDTS